MKVVRETHPENALFPTLVTLPGITTVLIDVLSSKARADMPVTGKLLYVDGMTRILSEQDPIPLTLYEAESLLSEKESPSLACHSRQTVHCLLLNECPGDGMASLVLYPQVEHVIILLPSFVQVAGLVIVVS